MSRKTIIVLLFFCIALIAAAVAWKWVFKKTEISVSSEKSVVEIEAALLVLEFENDEDASNAKYLDKVITVSGIVSSIAVDEQSVMVYLKNEEDVSGVSCSFNKTAYEVKPIKITDHVKIKGLCTGYLMDVQLTKCSLEP